MLFNDKGTLFPKQIEEIYDTYRKNKKSVVSFCYNWPKGSDGCFLSVIYIKNMDKSITLLTTRNNDACRKSKNPKSKKHYQYYSPTSVHIERVERIPSEDELYSYLMTHHSEYKTSITITDENRYLLDNITDDDFVYTSAHPDGSGSETTLYTDKQLDEFWNDFYQYYIDNIVVNKTIQSLDFGNELSEFYQLLKDNDLYDTFKTFNDLYSLYVRGEIDDNREKYCDGCILMGKKGCLGLKNYKETGETGVTGCTKYMNISQHKAFLHRKRQKDLPYKYLGLYYVDDKPVGVCQEKTEKDLKDVLNQLFQRFDKENTLDKHVISMVNCFYNEYDSANTLEVQLSGKTKIRFYKIS